MVWEIKVDAMLEDNQLALVTQHYAMAMHLFLYERYRQYSSPNNFANQQYMKRMSTHQDVLGMIVVSLLVLVCFCFPKKILMRFFFVVFCLLLFQNAPFTELSMTVVEIPWYVSFSRAYETCPVEVADQTTHLSQSTIENVSETSVLLFPISYAWVPSLVWEKDEETTPEHPHPELTLITSPRHDLNISILGWL